MPRFPLLYSSCFLLENVISTPFTLPFPMPCPCLFPCLSRIAEVHQRGIIFGFTIKLRQVLASFGAAERVGYMPFGLWYYPQTVRQTVRFFNFAILFCLQTVRLNLTYFNFLLPSFSVNFGLMLGKLWSDKLSTPLSLELAFCGGSEKGMGKYNIWKKGWRSARNPLDPGSLRRWCSH